MNSFFNILLFAIWPFGGFMYSLSRPLNKSTYFIFIGYFFLIGCSFYLQNDLADSYRYAENFIDFTENGADVMFLYHFVFLGQLDFYTYVISYICSIFSNSPRILFGFYGAFFGLFICCFWKLLKIDWNEKMNFYVCLLFIIIYFLNPHTNINGVRFWTATWVFFSSLISFFLFHSKKYLCAIFFTPLIHVSYILCLGVFAITYFIVQKKSAYIFFLFSFFVGFLLDATDLVSLLPSNWGMFSHFQAYIDEDYMSEITKQVEGRSMLQKVSSIVCRCFSFYLMYNIYQKEKHTLGDYKLLSFVLLLFSFCFLFGKIPSVGRFYTLAYMLMIFLLYRLYRVERDCRTSLWILMLIPVFAIPIYNNLIFHSAVLSPIYIYGGLSDIVNFALAICI